MNGDQDMLCVYVGVCECKKSKFRNADLFEQGKQMDVVTLCVD